jgi:hypothetical protein
VVESAANVKMLCWEQPFEKLLTEIRRAETRPMLIMMLIDGVNAAIFFFAVPLACIVTFGIAVAMNQVRLQSLLHLDCFLYTAAGGFVCVRFWARASLSVCSRAATCVPWC